MSKSTVYQTSSRPAKLQAMLACTAIICGTVLGVAGTDLVLPAVPALPEIFTTSIASSQLVMALYVAGSAAGLLLFGSLAGHIGRRRLFIGSLAQSRRSISSVSCRGLPQAGLPFWRPG